MSSFRETPIVLVHGILGFDRLGLPSSPVMYFRHIRDALKEAGYLVPEPPMLNSAGTIQERAADLQAYLDTHEDVKGRQVHLIAHSMGGLDSRYMISQLDGSDRILSLTTLGTPHRGTSIADFGLFGLGPALNFLDATKLVDLKGFFDLSRRMSREFEAAGELDSKDVPCFSVAGDYRPPLLPLGLLQASHAFISPLEGPNDGLVSVRSATFGTFLGTWEGNHFRLINWATNILDPIGELADKSIVRNYLELVQQVEQQLA